MKIIDGGVTAAKGFKAAAAAAEIKYKGRTDMAMVYSEVPCVAAGTFTTNVVKAAPVKWDQDIVYNHPSAQVVICNSGIANACTGAEGYGYCKETADAAAEILGVAADSVLVASTGVIGMQVPIDRIKNGVKMMAPKLDGSLEAGTEAAKAIMTTDTKKKEVAVQIEIGGKTVTVGGMCKGSGMIHPNMCTMLGFVTTDAKISKKMLQEALSEDVKDTYNMVSVDGDTSTNDTVLLLANGLAENPEITEKGEDYETFKAALNYINTTLAKKIAGDGEGATALFEVKIIGAESKEQAVTLSKSVVTSSLTKAAIYGHDANWGRILCAMGYSGAKFDPEKVDLFFESKAGKLQIIAADSIDRESWDNDGPARPRIEMQERWYNYVCEELTPRALEINREQGPDHMGKVLVGGASMGAGHAVNLFLRRPDLYNGTIALSGLYQADMFFKGYMDDLVYRNSPCDYMRNFPDNHPYKELYAKADKFIMCCGQGQWEEELLRSTLQLRDILESKDIHPIVDIWGQDVSHDWYWWEKQWVYFLEMTLGKA